jgi:hypothetical protein
LLTGFLAEVLGVIPIILICAALGLFLLGYSWFFTAFPAVEMIIQEKTDETPASTPIIGERK